MDSGLMRMDLDSSTVHFSSHGATRLLVAVMITKATSLAVGAEIVASLRQRFVGKYA